MFVHIVKQTNLYALQTVSHFSTNANEIEQYCVIKLKMGILVMPRYNMYWWNKFKFPFILEVINRDNFKKITRHIHSMTYSN